MSDFYSVFWDYYVAIITAVSVIGCGVFLWMQSKRTVKLVDGQDVVAVHEAVQWAVERARAGEGPSLVECKTYRFRAHSEGAPDVSHFELRPPDEVEAWKKRDPLLLFRERLLQEEIATVGELDRIDADAAEEADAAERFAIESPQPDPSVLQEMLYAR
ncbi:MAG: hypothetical protein DYG91_12980 [Chloroflexi bacterium CFX7]|nr:hypothetical protein [Chloroflexi bacterium CFX7]